MHGDSLETEQQTLSCDLESVRRIAAMLDLPSPDLHTACAVPAGWHFPFLGSHTRRCALRSDGFPGLGVPMPDLGLPRLLIAGRTVSYDGDLLIGSPLWRRSGIKSVDRRTGRNGDYAIVTIGLELGLQGNDAPSISEETKYFLLEPANAGGAKPPGSPVPLDQFVASRSIVPDDTLLFQFSALGFNSHKIHIDRDHATRVEGYPDLVVNGGLSTLLLTEFARTELKLPLRGLKLKFMAPLFANRTMTIGAQQRDDIWFLTILDNEQRPAVEAELTL